ncbi:MAG: hypothetical protein LUG50_13355 [Planctomycetaceae bacterium]|nr:hypothetical protein [Planctomycetaceae bacterium]
MTRDIALEHIRKGDRVAAKEKVRRFHKQLCETVILDPACGSGNFLFVSLNLIASLEAEIRSALIGLGDLEYLHNDQCPSVTPSQFKGIELNPHAADIAEVVLWIACLQSHYKNNGRVPPNEPIIPDDHVVFRGDAILAAEWPRADFIVGNPPFAGNKRLRTFLGTSMLKKCFGYIPTFPKTRTMSCVFGTRPQPWRERGK